MPELLDAFRIKHALKKIGDQNKAYGDIFAYYESLERKVDVLERRLKLQTEQMAAAAAAFQREREEAAMVLQGVKDEVSAKTSELMEESTKHAQCRKELRALRQKYDKLRRETEGKQGESDAVDDGDGDDLAVDKLKQKLDSLQRKSMEEKQKLTADFEKRIKALEEELALYRGKDGESFKGDLASLTPAVLKAAAKKNGWNARALPFLLNEEDQDIDQVCKQLKEYKEKVKKLEMDMKKKIAEQLDSAFMVLMHAADFLSSANSPEPMSTNDLIAAIAGGDDGKVRTHKVAAECKNSNAAAACKELAMMAAKTVEKLRNERNEERRRSAALAGGDASMKFRPVAAAGDSDEVAALKAENERLTVALEEMRYRLQKLESLAMAQGKGGDLRSLLMESGLDLGGSMQDWALRNVWERLYADAMARHERATARFVNHKKAFEMEMLGKAELYRIIGIPFDPPSPPGHQKPVVEPERSLQLPGSYNVSLDSVFGGQSWDEDEQLRKARRRVHELIAAQGGKARSDDPGDKPVKLNPVMKHGKQTKSMPPSSWRNLGSSAPIPQSKKKNQQGLSKNIVLEEAPAGKGMGETASTPDLRAMPAVQLKPSSQSLYVSGGGVRKGEAAGTRPGTTSDAAGTRPGTESTRAGTRPQTVGDLGTRPGTHDGLGTRPTSQEHQQPGAEMPTWMPAPLGRTK